MRAAGGGRVPGPDGEGGGAGEEPRRLLQVPRPRSQPPTQKPRLRGRGVVKRVRQFFQTAQYIMG
jgi:hypothetical protein